MNFARMGVCAAPRVLAVAAVALAVVALAGCLGRPSGPDTPTMQRIESASYIIEYPNHRLELLKRIARQPDLQQHEQTYLVNVIMPLGFSSDRADALLNLIENPSSTPETYTQIRKQLRFTRMFGRDVERVLRALDRAEDAARMPPDAAGEGSV